MWHSAARGVMQLIRMAWNDAGLTALGIPQGTNTGQAGGLHLKEVPVLLPSRLLAYVPAGRARGGRSEPTQVINFTQNRETETENYGRTMPLWLGSRAKTCRSIGSKNSSGLLS